MNDPAPRIVAVGDLTADLIVEVPALPIRADDFLLAEEMHLEPGGSANLLILLSRLGAAAVALGTLGKDLWGEEVSRILESEEVEISSIRREGTTTVALVLVDSHRRHSFIGAYGKGEPPAFGDHEGAVVAGADAVFTSGYSLGEARLKDLMLEALGFAGKRGIPRFFDPGPAFQTLETEVKRRALDATDVLLLTEDELSELSPTGVEALLRVETGSPAAPRPAADSPARAGAARRSGPNTVVVKRGPAGCRVYTGSPEGTDIPGLPIAVRDTTAAGDCFDAGYIWAYLGGRSPEECARLANCAGAAAVGKLGGGRNVPSVQELRELILSSGGDVEI
jgi:sugar/nucleoside kinase (ribokinase family)